MSYNYLPLDRKWINYQQVKNLLDFDQWVSITFDAHERILHSSEYVVGKKALTEPASIDPPGNERVPLPVVKLAMMLKLKSLSTGCSGIQIETAKRLMEMYNRGIWPVVLVGGNLQQASRSAMQQLVAPLSGNGTVVVEGKEWATADVQAQQGWQPLQLTPFEAEVLPTGHQFISAVAMWALKRSEQVLKMATVITAIEMLNDGADCRILKEMRLRNGHSKVLKTIQALLNGAELQDAETTQPVSKHFSATIHGLGAGWDSFNHVKDIFLKEINIPGETLLVLAEEERIAPLPQSPQGLLPALNYLLDTMHTLAEWWAPEAMADRNNDPLRGFSWLSEVEVAEQAIAYQLLKVLQNRPKNMQGVAGALANAFEKADSPAGQDRLEKAFTFVTSYPVILP